MSCFICNECGKFIDSDYSGCEEDPKCGTELICLECYGEFYDEEGAERNPQQHMVRQGDQPVQNAEGLAHLYHKYYQELQNQFVPESQRQVICDFDKDSNNGKFLIAICDKVLNSWEG